MTSRKEPPMNVETSQVIYAARDELTEFVAEVALRMPWSSLPGGIDAHGPFDQSYTDITDKIEKVLDALVDKVARETAAAKRENMRGEKVYVGYDVDDTEVVDVGVFLDDDDAGMYCDDYQEYLIR